MMADIVEGHGDDSSDVLADACSPPPPAPPLDPCLDFRPKGFVSTPRKTFDPLRLHFAINKGDIEAARHQIQRDIDLNFIIHGNTPLTLAIVKEQYEIAVLIINAGADVTLPEKTRWRRQPLHLASEVGHLTLMRALIDHGANIQAIDNMQMTPLHWSSIKGHFLAVEYLLDNGAHINVKDDRGRTPLFRAAENDHFDVFRLLYTEGASINTRDMYGWTPLFQAIVCNQLKMVQELISYGANVNHRNNRWQTPMHMVVGRLQPQNLLTLCRTHADFYTRNLRMATPAVHRAIRQCSDDYTLVRLLLDAGAEVNVLDVGKTTPLRIAADDGNVYLIHWMVQAGADLSMESWIMSKEWPEKLVNQAPEMCQWLTEKVLLGVKPLMELGKYAVRRSLAPNISIKIAQLPVPSKVKQYLHLDF